MAGAAKVIGTAGGSAAGTVTVDTNRLSAVEVMLIANSGAGTVTMTWAVGNHSGSVFASAVSIPHSGSGTTKATIISPAGGVPLGIGSAEARFAVSGTINYTATLIGRM